MLSVWFLVLLMKNENKNHCVRTCLEGSVAFVHSNRNSNNHCMIWIYLQQFKSLEEQFLKSASTPSKTFIQHGILNGETSGVIISFCLFYGDSAMVS